MQVRNVVTAGVLGLMMATATAQEIDPGETLQAKSLAAQVEVRQPVPVAAASEAHIASSSQRVATASPAVKVAKRSRKSDWSHIYNWHHGKDARDPNAA